MVSLFLLRYSKADLSNCQGNLLGDLSALLFFITHPTIEMTSQLKAFATRLVLLPLDVNALDLAIFLDGLAHAVRIFLWPVFNDISLIIWTTV